MSSDDGTSSGISTAVSSSVTPSIVLSAGSSAGGGSDPPPPPPPPRTTEPSLAMLNEVYAVETVAMNNRVLQWTRQTELPNEIKL